MPGKVKVKIIAGRNLPVMDRSSDTTDAYVEIKLGNTSYKTDVCRKSLNPQWNSEWYRFEMDDAELQDEPLQIRLMDHDTYSANDAIGKVYIDLNPLLLPSSTSTAKSSLLPDSTTASNSSISVGNTMSGWFPVYDTMHGIRGEVNIIVKVELFSDFNKFRQSSCGVQFFNSSVIPQGYHAQVIHGLVEELIVSDDPEYQWIDKIRTPRASNEARQTIFLKLSGEVQRKIGLKVLDLGGNAVIGYKQCFDLEGESGIVVRGIGTAATLIRLFEHVHTPRPMVTTEESVPEDVTVQQQSSGPSISIKTSQSPAKASISTSIHRRSSDSDLSITPKGNSLTGSDRSSVAGGIARPLPSVFLRPSLYKEASDSLEYPFLTMSKYPPGFILHLGGLIQSRSVKLLERITNIEEPESRDSWWSELRLEIRSHARALSCNIVLGYSEHTAICDDVCVLSASGTAAVVSVRPSEVSSLNSSGVAANLSDTPEGPAIVTLPKQFSNLTTSLDRPDYERQAQVTQFKQEGSSGSGKQRHHSDSMEPGTETNILPCNPCHLPYSVKKMTYSVDAPKCGVCRKARVPDVMYCTIEPPDNIPVAGQCCLLQAYVCRPKRDCRSELNAKEISDALPFLEYELHSQLLNKLRVSGMNAVFGLKVQICLGEKMIGALATGTGVLLAALPPPPAPVVTPGNAFQDDEKLAEIQKKLQESIKQNRDYYQLRPVFNTSVEGDAGAAVSDTEESEDDLPELDLTAGNKDACILVIDDAEDADVITRLIDPLPPNGFHVSATESLPGLEDLCVVRNLQMFTQIWRSKVPPVMPLSSYNKHFHKLLQGVYFKLRRMVPCAIGNVHFLVEMPEPEEMQISVVGMALGLAETERTNRHSRKKHPSLSSSKDMTKKDDPEMIFCLEEDQESSGPVTTSAAKPVRPGSPVRSEKKKPKHVSPKEHYGVDITTLSFIPGARIERYLGNLNFFFIRESTSVREGGGMSGFVHSFVAEVLAIVRAHITALGGNAMVAYSMCDCILHNNPHKNNGQCLVNVVGDAVYVSYPQE